MFIMGAGTEVYRCPGENYDISRAVHLARLAVSYSKCRHCPHAPGAPAAAEKIPSELPAATPGSGLFTSEGIRGRYLNDLTRTLVAEIAGAFASCLWDDFARPGAVSAGARLPTAEGEGYHSRTALPADTAEAPPIGNDCAADPDSQTSTEGFRILAPGRPGPSVVLAHDQRPSSPDIVMGVGQALRRMGCQIIDVGLATRPCFAFTVHHLRASGGVHVTGAGCDPGWTGVDFLTRGIIPCSSPGALERIAARHADGYSRPSRRPGSQRTFQGAVPYEAGLLKHFHALRPLKIALACPNGTVRDLLSRTFRRLACRLFPVETPTRARAVLDPHDPDVARTARHVREKGTDLGLLVEDDGEQCVFVNEQGRVIPPAKIARMLAIDQGAGTAVATAEQSTREAVTVAMVQDGAPFAIDGRGRYWFVEAYPACDAVLTLVNVLHALSRSDAPMSEVIAKSASPA
jgi:phosphomannomutase